MSSYHSTTPFIYQIGWTDLNAWYLGIRYAVGCQPSDLWTTYFTSSKIVADIRDTWGEPDIVDILSTGPALQVQEWEHLLIVGLQLHRGSRWLNRAAYKAFDGQRTEEMNARVSRSMKALLSTETGRAERSAQSAAYWSNSDNRNARSESFKAKWNDPVFKADVLAKRYATAAQNGFDRSHSDAARENHSRGESHPNARLDAQKVSEIRASSESAPTLAPLYGVSAATINNIRSRRTWKHVR